MLDLQAVVQNLGMKGRGKHWVVVTSQERLNEVTVGGEQFAADGAFGEQTEEAVREFQEANDLGVDGVVGPATGELLGIWAG